MHMNPPPQVSHPIAVIAHRGASSLAPEGTLPAYRKAIELGCDYVELDVRRTADGRLICLHDRQVDRTTNGAGMANQLTADYIRSLDAGSHFSAEFAGERIPFFEEAVALCAGQIGIYLDWKDAPIPQVVEVLRRHGVVDRTVVYGYTVGQLAEIKAYEPGLRVMPGLDDLVRVPGVITAVVRHLGAEVLDSHVTEWDRRAVEEAHAAGSLVWVDIMGRTETAEGMAAAIEMGVDGIQTDRPQLLLEVLAARGAA